MLHPVRGTGPEPDHHPFIRDIVSGAAFGLDPRQEHARLWLDRLAASPPQALIIEGGRADERAAMALYFAARINCAEAAPPCGVCHSCSQILDKVFVDLLFFDGLAGSIKAEDVRELRLLSGEPPRGAGMRAVIFSEAQWITDVAANALLKTMEEPRPGNCFMLLAPQRERLFPTLVSRSWVATLAWPDRDAPLQRLAGPEAAEGAAPDENIEEWTDALMRFWSTGGGWFELTSTRGRTTRLLGQHVLLSCSRSLAQALCGDPRTPLAAYLHQNFAPANLRRFDILLAETQEALINMVNPALALDWLATRVYCWLRA